MIHVEHLYHSYGRNDTFQVNDISFDVGEGEIFGFLGPNGAGKSTTQNIMIGLLPLQRGQVTIAGHDIRRPRRELFNLIGVSFEQPNVYKRLTGMENLQFFRGLYAVPTTEPRELLARLGLADAANKRAGTYSKGMQQRAIGETMVMAIAAGAGPLAAEQAAHLVPGRAHIRPGPDDGAVDQAADP